jgi:Flp pilus assembly pilin Flp
MSLDTDKRGIAAVEYGIIAAVLGVILLIVLGVPGDPMPNSFAAVLYRLFTHVATSI